MPFGIVAYALTLLLDNLSRNSCITKVAFCLAHYLNTSANLVIITLKTLNVKSFFLIVVVCNSFSHQCLLIYFFYLPQSYFLLSFNA